MYMCVVWCTGVVFHMHISVVSNLYGRLNLTLVPYWLHALLGLLIGCTQDIQFELHETNHSSLTSRL